MKKYKLVITILLLTIGSAIFAISPIIVDFESPTYSTGNLPGQDSWTNALNGNDFDVVNSGCYEGSQCVYVKSVSGATAVVRKLGSEDLDEGNIIFYVYPISLGSSDNNDLYLENDSSSGLFAINWDSLDPGYFTCRGASNERISAVSASTWYKLEIEWRSSDGYGRCRVDDGAWTDWIDRISSNSGDVHQIALQSNPQNRGEYYLDYIYGSEEEEEATTTFENINNSKVLALFLFGIFIITLFDFLRRVFIMKKKT